MEARALINPRKALALVQSDNITVYDYDIIPVLAFIKNIINHTTVLAPPGSKVLSDAIRELNLEYMEVDPPTISSETDEDKYNLLDQFTNDAFFGSLKTNGVGFLNYALFDRIFYLLSSKPELQVNLNHFDLVILVGAASSGFNITNLLSKQAKKSNIPIWGFPLGDIEGRLAPFWPFFCDKAFVKREQKNNLINMGFSQDEIEIYNDRPINIDWPKSKNENDTALLDATCLPIPNPDLFRTLKTLEVNNILYDYILHVPENNNRKLYDILLTKRLRSTKIRYAQPNTYLNDLSSSKFVLTFGPVYRSMRMLKSLNISSKLFAVDYHRRFELIDGTNFNREGITKINNEEDLVTKLSEGV